MEQTSPTAIMVQIIKDYGTEIYLDKVRLCGLIADFFYEHDKLKNWLTRSIRDYNLSVEIYRREQLQEPERTNSKKALFQQFWEYSGFAKENAETVFSCLDCLVDREELNALKELFRKCFLKEEFFGYFLSRCYPFSSELIDRYKDKRNWYGLSGNSSLPWSIELIDRYKDKWSWNELSGNSSLPWSVELIDRYKDKWEWLHLSENPSLPWSINLIEQYANKWDWSGLSENPSLPWSLDLIKRYADKWDWKRLSWNKSIGKCFKPQMLETLIANNELQSNVLVVSRPETGELITAGKNPEWGSVRVESKVLVNNGSGMIVLQKRVAFVRMQMELGQQLIQAGLIKDNKPMPIPGKIIIKESLEPFYEGQEPKINPQTGDEVLYMGSMPIYRQAIFASNESAKDELIDNYVSRTQKVNIVSNK